MRKETLNRFKKLFIAEKQKLLFSDRTMRGEFSMNADDRFDEVDQASTDVEQSMRMRLCNRETLYMKKVDEALRRIEEGTFGLCDSCEEEIGLKRLDARPTATLCVGCKEDQERKEIHTAAGLAHKSLGDTFAKRLG
jgi:DnaK suppressor protein